MLKKFYSSKFDKLYLSVSDHKVAHHIHMGILIVTSLIYWKETSFILEAIEEENRPIQFIRATYTYTKNNCAIFLTCYI